MGSKRLDIDLVEQVLETPPKQPDYRRDRSHAAFCMNLTLPASDLKESIALAWEARPTHLVLPDLAPLVEEKYGNPDWTERF